MATDTNKHLDCVISSHMMSKEEKLLNKHIEKRDDVKEGLEKEFGSNLYAPINSGSYPKNTAVNTKFDFDLVAPFKRNAFGSGGTLEQMYDSVYKFLYAKYHGKGAIVRRQKVSIGIEFDQDADGHIVKIDVVPGRELNQDQYHKDKNLNLFVFEEYGKLPKGSDYIKTNIQAQIDNIRDRATREKDSIRKIIRLLKVWKIGKGTGPKSFFLELITIKSFDSQKIEGALWDKLEKVLEYIRDNVTKNSFSLPDPGNSGNDVAETLTTGERSTLSYDMKTMLERIEENSDIIKSYFRINEKHPCDGGDNKYGVKREGFSAPPVQRFG